MKCEEVEQGKKVSGFTMMDSDACVSNKDCCWWWWWWGDV